MRKPTDKRLHPNASSKVKSLVERFRNSLTSQATMLAHQRGDDIVLSTHIDEALNIIEDRYKYQRSKECFKIIGATLFGVFLQGFITELTTGHALNLVLYTVSGFLGMLFVFLGLRK